MTSDADAAAADAAADTHERERVRRMRAQLLVVLCCLAAVASSYLVARALIWSGDGPEAPSASGRPPVGIHAAGQVADFGPALRVTILAVAGATLAAAVGGAVLHSIRRRARTAPAVDAAADQADGDETAAIQGTSQRG